MLLINALETGNKNKVNAVLRLYKTQNGAVDYPTLLRIPTGDRIRGLIEAGGYQRIHVMLSAGIHMALESLNLSRSLSPEQIIDLVDALLDSATEDNLGVEDVVLFLQKLVRGEAGKLYNSLDVPKFMEAFEDYRQDRHVTLLRIREEQEAQYKVSGRSNRTITTDKGDIDAKTLLELMQAFNEERNENKQAD